MPETLSWLIYLLGIALDPLLAGLLCWRWRWLQAGKWRRRWVPPVLFLAAASKPFAMIFAISSGAQLWAGNLPDLGNALDETMFVLGFSALGVAAQPWALILCSALLMATVAAWITTMILGNRWLFVGAVALTTLTVNLPLWLLMAGLVPYVGP